MNRSDPDSRADTAFTPAYRYYILSVLFAAYVVNIMDRNVFAAVLEPIRLEFDLTDSEMGFLGGLAFAFFYATLGIPIARLADRSNRRNLLALALGLWSVMTALCGAAVGFLTLLLARMGVGVGEAGGTPPSHSLISDYFPFNRRSTALSIYALGVPLGISLGNLLGGWGHVLIGWRLTFVAIGLPGLALAAVVRFGLAEPPRGLSDEMPARARLSDPPTLSQVASFLWKRTSFRHMCLGAALHASVWYGASLWNNAYFIRVHGMTTGEAGSWIALFALVGMVGTFLGGHLSDRLSAGRDDSRWYMWLPGTATLLILPFAATAYLSTDMRMIVPAFSIKVILASVYFGPAFAMTQAVAAVRMRAVAAALLLFTQTLVGLGVGPLLVGMISDYLEPTMEARSLAWGLVTVALLNVWAGGHYFWGARTIRQDIEATARVNAGR